MRRVTLPGGMALAAVLSALAAVTWFGAMRLAGELAAQDARQRIVRWESGRTKAEPSDVRAALAQMRDAAAYDVGNPKLLSDMAWLEFWRVRGEPMDDPVARSARQAALDAFRSAARQRPAAADLWVGIAQTRFLLGSADIEFGAALEQTLRWAPWHPELQTSAIQLGLATWQALDEPRQRLIAEAIQRQATWKLTDRKPELIRLLKAYGRPELGCPWAGKSLGCPGA